MIFYIIFYYFKCLNFKIIAMSIEKQDLIVNTNNSLNEDDNNISKSSAIENNTLEKEAVISTETG